MTRGILQTTIPADHPDLFYGIQPRFIVHGCDHLARIRSLLALYSNSNGMVVQVAQALGHPGVADSDTPVLDRHYAAAA